MGWWGRPDASHHRLLGLHPGPDTTARPDMASTSLFTALENNGTVSTGTL